MRTKPTLNEHISWGLMLRMINHIFLGEFIKISHHYGTSNKTYRHIQNIEKNESLARCELEDWMAIEIGSEFSQKYTHIYYGAPSSEFVNDIKNAIDKEILRVKSFLGIGDENE